jgi:hypothetical protein
VSIKLEAPLSEKTAETAITTLRRVLAHFDTSIYAQDVVPETSIILLTGVSAAALTNVGKILTATQGISLLH